MRWETALGPVLIKPYHIYLKEKETLNIPVQVSEVFSLNVTAVVRKSWSIFLTLRSMLYYFTRYLKNANLQ